MALFSGVLGLVALACAVWVIYDILTVQKRMNSTNKIIWVICAIVFSIITAIIYYFVFKRK